MIYFAVCVIDHFSRATCTVGEMLTRGEALRLARTISEFQACEVYVVESEYNKSKGDKRR